MPISQISIPSCSNLQYYDSDELNKSPLVILGANPSDVRDYDGIKAVLEKKHRLVAINWPGFGGSSLDGDNYQGGALFLHQVMLEFLSVLNIPRACFIGVGVGGYCAMRLALEHPTKVSKLILVSPTGFAPGGLLARHYAPLMSGRFAPAPLTHAKSYMGHKEKPLIQQMLERAATIHSTPGAISMTRAIWKSLGEKECDMTERAANIQAPIMLVFGEKDPIVPPMKDGKAARRTFGDETMYVCLESRHLPFAEVPEEFLNAISPFLNAYDDDDLL